jgi:hypothetical protein
MKASFNNIDEVFDFQGLWGQESKCGLQIVYKGGKFVVIVSELYQLNPGTSITQAATALAGQICQKHDIPPNDLIYFEHTPEMNSKLSFYTEEFYRVEFRIENGYFAEAFYNKVEKCEIVNLLQRLEV